VIIILGFFAFFQWEFSLAGAGGGAGGAGIFGQRVGGDLRPDPRELPALPQDDTVEIINNAITSTISRTIITHGSTQIMVLSMLLFGGETLYYFALALTIGICFGIYSSVFVGAAIAMWLGIKREDLVKGTSRRRMSTPTTRMPGPLSETALPDKWLLNRPRRNSQPTCGP
jgi:preprotein translocase subunit SecF